MNFEKGIAISIAFLLIFMAAQPVLHASTFNKATKVTFNSSVQVPGKVLAAGSYWLQSADRMSGQGQNVVQIYNHDRSKLITTIMAVTAERPNPNSVAPMKPVVTVAERRAGEPPALTGWFYWNSVYGQQFLYNR